MGGSSSSEKAAQPPPPQGAPSGSSSRRNLVQLNVYSPTGGQHAVYHTGVEVLGAEYVFGGGDTAFSGVSAQRPRVPPPGSGWVFYQTVELGDLKVTREEAHRIVAELQGEFPGNSYDLVKRNCNHFSDALAKKLCNGQGIPSWVNRAAGIGAALGVDNAVRRAVGAPAPAADTGKADGVGGPAAAGLVARSAAVDGSLNGEVDWAAAGVLNANIEDAVGAIQGGSLVSSADGPELLLLLPLVSPVKLQAVQLEAPDESQAPRRLRLFANERNLDMADACGGVAPTQDVELQWSPCGGSAVPGTVCANVEVKFLKFQNLSFLSLYFSGEEEDDEAIVAIQGLRLVGKV
eukprot:TRINITY_DN45728_c0_g1_i1.p1 TRINITY_DN45728_c0_g1~~TRINITY_DN45728_c0_g1_i1.p1  ORF type:complete len:369 (+),score=71.94 TRINITY_DN45728_c0_g1_i1:64-1107(+)